MSPRRGALQYLLHYVTPLDPWNPGFRLQNIFSETRMKPGISRDLAYILSVMGFRGSPVRIRPSRLTLRSTLFLLWGLFAFAEDQSGRTDSAGSRSEDASGAGGERQNRRFEPSVGASSIDPRLLRETSGGRRRRPELNPAVPTYCSTTTYESGRPLLRWPCPACRYHIGTTIDAHRGGTRLPRTPLSNCVGAAFRHTRSGPTDTSTDTVGRETQCLGQQPPDLGSGVQGLGVS